MAAWTQDAGNWKLILRKPDDRAPAPLCSLEPKMATERQSGITPPLTGTSNQNAKLSAKLGPQTPQDRRDLSYSAGWIKHQLRRQILMPLRNHVLHGPNTPVHWRGGNENREFGAFTWTP